MNTDDPIIGIDLGTTNSEVAVFKDGRVEIVVENNRDMLPSVVGLDNSGQLIVGDEARNQYVLYPERTIKSIKRKMGSDEKVRLGDKEYLPQEISAIILRELKARAERCLGHRVAKAVITVPAYFSDAQRQATRDAGAIAGLEVVRILNEPTAACLAYESTASQSVKNVLAFDLGGGTFDVSVVKMQGDLVEVIASHGDNRLGGDDFDELLLHHILKEYYKQQQTSAALAATSLSRLQRSAEAAKIRLSDDYYTAIIEDNLSAEDGVAVHLETEVSRDQFEAVIGSLLAKTLTSVHHALAQARLKPADIDEAILVGGSTRIPAVSRLLNAEIAVQPRQDVHPYLAVAYGAGVMAARLMGAKDQRILVDITPYTFGTSAFALLNGEYVPYAFVPIIKASTPLPVRRSDLFYTLQDGQDVVDCSIFQGDHDDARQNILVGKFRVEGLSDEAPAGNPIVIHMHLDLDGILRVTATEKRTGLSKNVTIEHSLDKLDADAVARSREQVAQLFGGDTLGGGDLDDEGEAPILAPPDADRHNAGTCREILRRLEAAKARMDDVDRKDAESLANELNAAMANGDDKKIGALITSMEDLLFFLETES